MSQQEEKVTITTQSGPVELTITAPQVMVCPEPGLIGQHGNPHTAPPQGNEPTRYEDLPGEVTYLNSEGQPVPPQPEIQITFVAPSNQSCVDLRPRPPK